MKKTFITVLAVAGLLFTAQAVFAMVERVPATNTKSGQSVIIPGRAVQVAPNVFSLGESIDPERGDVVEGYLIVHPKKGYEKPSGTPGKGKGGGGGSTTSSCYGFLAKDAKWKSVEPWVVNPTNPYGITDSSILSILGNGIAKWEDATDGVVGNNTGVDILGAGSITSVPLVADTVSMDLQNEVYFDSLDAGTIGVTIVWGVFNGPPFARELREWDQVYNTFYQWSDNGSPLAMDFENIATHELGHSVGMGDLYDTACSEETMYGYGTEGETKKSDLNIGDITGINQLY